MAEEIYAGVLARVKAIVTDAVVLIVFMLLTTFIFSFFKTVPDSARAIAFVFIFGLYEPIFTSLFGGTIGHMIVGIRVRRENQEDRKILFPHAIIRFIVKGLLGWISLLTIATNERKRAIHDLLAGSVVIYKR